MESHEWVRYLTGEDAQTLLWQLCQWVSDPALSREDLTKRVQAWEKRARQAVGGQAWSVKVDHALGVCLSEWLYRFAQRAGNGG